MEISLQSTNKAHYRLFFFTIIALVVLSWFATSALAGVYYYIDEKGSYHFSDMKQGPHWRPFTPSRKRLNPTGNIFVPSASGIMVPVAPNHIARFLGPPISQDKIFDMIQSYSTKYGIDADLVRAVAKVESNFDVYAVSKKGACGLMQLMPETARDWGVNNSFDPAQNLDGGIQILCDLLRRFDGDLALTLAAYNAGMTNVLKHGGVPPFPETIDYIKQVTDHYLQYRDAPNQLYD